MTCWTKARVISRIVVDGASRLVYLVVGWNLFMLKRCDWVMSVELFEGSPDIAVETQLAR